ncbi:MAG: SRPBCC family protein [Patescibacteria group bacterium]
MKPLKKNKLTITIKKSVSEVFAFLLDPANSPRWIDSFVYEETSEWPVKEGTIYRNKNRQGEWNEYTVTSFEQDKTFILKMGDGNYHVQYTFLPISKTETQMEYYEWVIRDMLAEPYTQEALMKLKTVVEQL